MIYRFLIMIRETSYKKQELWRFWLEEEFLEFVDKPGSFLQMDTDNNAPWRLFVAQRLYWVRRGRPD